MTATRKLWKLNLKMAMFPQITFNKGVLNFNDQKVSKSPDLETVYKNKKKLNRNFVYLVIEDNRNPVYGFSAYSRDIVEAHSPNLS